MPTYEFDPTGRALQNKIIGESKTLNLVNGSTHLFVVPTFAPFFEDTLEVKHTSTGGAVTILQPDVDYVCGLQYVDATQKTNRAVYTAINLINITLTGTLTYNYQGLGGTYELTAPQIDSLQNNVTVDPPFASLESLISMPAMAVIEHPWSVVNVPDIKRVTEELDAVGLAIHLRPKFVNAPDANHFIPTKTEIGLGNVQNYATATNAEAIAGVLTNKHVTPAGVAAAIPGAVATTLSATGIL